MSKQYDQYLIQHKANVTKCKVCGCKFNALTEKHYISQDSGSVGMEVAFGSTPEVKIYDTYDCPQCGSQCVVQERKRMATTPEKEGMK